MNRNLNKTPLYLDVGSAEKIVKIKNLYHNILDKIPGKNDFEILAVGVVCLKKLKMTVNGLKFYVFPLNGSIL